MSLLLLVQQALFEHVRVLTASHTHTHHRPTTATIPLSPTHYCSQRSSYSKDVEDPNNYKRGEAMMSDLQSALPCLAVLPLPLSLSPPAYSLSLSLSLSVSL